MSSITAYSTFRAWLIAGVLAIAVVASALAVTYTTFKGRQLVAEFQRVQEQRSDHHVERGQLLLEQSTWGSFNRIEAVATKQLTMKVPEPDAIVMVSQ